MATLTARCVPSLCSTSAAVAIFGAPLLLGAPVNCQLALPLPVTSARTMLLRPNRMKYRKSQKNIRAVLPVVPPEGVSKPPLHFGDYGIYAMESIRLKAAQIEAARMAILKTVGRKGLKIWIRTFPHIPVTKKPLEVRMGKGKGSVDHFIANVRAGKMIFEFNCPSPNTAKLAFNQARYKLPIRVKFVQREQTNTQ